MARPRLPDVAHEAPSADEIASGEIFACWGTCGLTWPRRLASKVFGLCRNCRRAQGRAVARGIHLRRYYGLTEQLVAQMRRDQSNACAACRSPMTDPSVDGRISDTDMTVDHDHSRAVVRGLLCHRCNKILGLAHDDVALLTAIVDYAQRAAGDPSLRPIESPREWKKYPKKRSVG